MNSCLLKVRFWPGCPVLVSAFFAGTGRGFHFVGDKSRVRSKPVYERNRLLITLTSIAAIYASGFPRWPRRRTSGSNARPLRPQDPLLRLAEVRESYRRFQIAAMRLQRWPRPRLRVLCGDRAGNSDLLAINRGYAQSRSDGPVQRRITGECCRAGAAA